MSGVHISARERDGPSPLRPWRGPNQLRPTPKSSKIVSISSANRSSVLNGFDDHNGSRRAAPCRSRDAISVVFSAIRTPLLCRVVTATEKCKRRSSAKRPDRLAFGISGVAIQFANATQRVGVLRFLLAAQRAHGRNRGGTPGGNRGGDKRKHCEGSSGKRESERVADRDAI